MTPAQPTPDTQQRLICPRCGLCCEHLGDYDLHQGEHIRRDRERTTRRQHTEQFAAHARRAQQEGR